MNSVTVLVPPEVVPVVAALHRLHRDIGSIPGARGMRLLSVAVADAAAVVELNAGLQRELAGEPAALALIDRCAVLALPLDSLLVVFLDVATPAA